MSAAFAVESRACALLEHIAQHTPDACASASGRVNLIGDHVDYAGGMVLPMAIAARTAVAAARAGADDFYSECEADSRWKRYAEGVLAQLREQGIDVPTAVYAVASDVPLGAGLSSSAALEVAFARCALALATRELSHREIALLCQRAEHVYAKVPCGIMDQWCVTHAREGEAIALDCATLTHTAVQLPNQLRIELIDSHVRHTLGDGAYAARRADVENAAAMLGVEHLALLPRQRWCEIEHLPNPIAKRARHVVTENARVHEACRALRDHDLARLGMLLNESHASLRDDFEVSRTEVDALVAQARANGALGARMTGAGFGGYVIAAYCSTSH